MSKKPMQQHFYGWRPEPKDHRDRRYTAPYTLLLAPLPKAVDLRPQQAEVWNQGQLGACTGHGITACTMHLAMFQWMQKHPGHTWTDARAAVTMRSRLGLYYLERAMEGTILSDAGGMIRDGIKALVKWGCGSEQLWPYDVSKFTQKPPAVWYKDGLNNQLLTYTKIPDGSLMNMKACLAEGFPFVFGFTVYESFESAAVAKTGVMPIPKRTERALGGHCVAAVGYDDVSQRLIVRNSWGTGWGQKGYVTMPYACTPDCTDCWTLRTEEVAP